MSSTTARMSAYSLPPASQSEHPASTTQRIRSAATITRLRPVSIAVSAEPVVFLSRARPRTTGREAINALALFVVLCATTAAVALLVVAAFFR